MNDRRTTSVESILDRQQRSIDHMSEQLPQLTSDVASLNTKMDILMGTVTAFRTVENNTIRHGTINKILGGFIVLVFPVLVTWNVYLAQQIQALALSQVVLKLRIDTLEAKNEASKTKTNP